MTRDEWKRLVGYIVLVALCATVGAIVLASLMAIFPGAVAILPFAICWWARPLPTYDLDAELALLLKEGR